MAIVDELIQKKEAELPVDEHVEGLTELEARRRLEKYGPNAIPEAHTNLWLVFLRKLWAPVPWMLEVSILLEIILGKTIEAAVIGGLLLFNAWMSTLQENKARTALALLRKQLSVVTRVLRDGVWRQIDAAALVPGDVVYLRMGDIVPADVALNSGRILLDQSTLTGESLPVDAGAGAPAYAGTVVRRGEATGTVNATALHTRFGKTAELVNLAKSTSQLERIVFSITRSLIILDAFLVVVVLIYALISGLPMKDLLPFALILLVASVPVALPATFTVATALGALELAKKGVLVTHLNAIEEAASMQVLCTDKTGTLTENRLELAQVKAFPPYTEQDVLRYAVLASDPATQDPLDKAILLRAQNEKLDGDLSASRSQFIPFDPATKRSEAVFTENGRQRRVMKGAALVVEAFDKNLDGHFAALVEDLASQGLRVLAVAAGEGEDMHTAGLLAFQDPPRPDSAPLIARLRQLGIRVVMITGDGIATARAIAARIGIGSRACSRESLNDPQWSEANVCEVYAEALPEDKFNLVKRLQSGGCTVGMTGDGVNDAPALKQAEVGIAVSSATDVAKAAASLVLTTPGLGNLVSAIETSRQIYQRMLTYTLNKIIKTIEIAFFLSLGLIFTRTFVTTPLLMVLLLFTNDFVTMSISTDRVNPTLSPNRWNVRSIVIGAVALALPILLLSFAIFGYASAVLHLPLANLQTLLFTMLVFSGQGTIYLVRERRHFWHSRPSKWMIIGSIVDITVVSLMATQGILMAPVPPLLVAETLGAIIIYLVLLDQIKVPLFARLHLS